MTGGSVGGTVGGAGWGYAAPTSRLDLRATGGDRHARWRYCSKIFHGGWSAAIAPGKSAAAPDAAAARTGQRDRVPTPLLPPLDAWYHCDDGRGRHRDLPHSCRAATLMPLIILVPPRTTGWRAPAYGARSAIADTRTNRLSQFLPCQLHTGTAESQPVVHLQGLAIHPPPAR